MGTGWAIGLMAVLLTAPYPGRAAPGPAADGPPTAEPWALLARYEASLAPYERMRGRWKVEIEGGPPGDGAARPPHVEEWAILRDRDRARVAMTPPGDEAPSYEAVKQGRRWIAVYANGHVSGHAEASPRVDAEYLGMAPSAPAFGIADQRRVAGFLRAAKLDARREPLDGRDLLVLRGVDGDVEVALWLDPALGHAARRVRLEKRPSEGDPSARTWQFDVTRFEERGGRPVAAEAASVLTVGPQPVLSAMVVERVVDGRRVREHRPAKDDDGKVKMSPRRRDAWKVSLLALEFEPKWGDREFEPSRPIPEGTRVHMQDDLDARYEWRGGAPALVAAAPVPAERPRPAAGAADAEEVLARARARAASEKKLILAHVGFPACGWCRIFEGFLRANARLFEDDFVVAKIDVETMARGEEVAERLRDGTDPSGYPWIAVLDAGGKPLGTSVRPNGQNIGCPVLPREIEYFAEMLRKAGRPDAARLEAIRAALEQYMGPYRKDLPASVRGS